MANLDVRLPRSVPNAHRFSHEATPPSDQLERFLGQAGDRIQHLKQTLLSVDSQIRELKLETIHDDLLTLQQDLSLRAAAIERFPVVQGHRSLGGHSLRWRCLRRFVLSRSLRGPFLVPPDDTLVLRVDDILIMIGLQADLAQVASEFTQARNAKSA